MNLELLSQEYFKLAEIIAHYEDRLMIVKGWSITVGLALIGYAFKQQQRAILILCCINAVCFAFVDAKFKEYQTNYYTRMHAIEKCVAQPVLEMQICIPLQINSTWFETWRWYGVFLQFAKLSVLIPHLILFISAICLYRKWNKISSNIN